MRTEPAESCVGQTAVSLDAIMDYVALHRGLDMRDYRRSTVERRLRGRMLQARTSDYGAYLTLLIADAQEVDRLIGSLMINISSFFRKAAVFERLRDVALPDLARRTAGEPVRCWSAGCGAGEEAYSLAMLLAEAGQPGEVVASDVDEAALEAARLGRYRRSALIELPDQAIAARFREEPGARGPLFAVDGALRGRVSFVRHNLLAAEGSPDGGLFHLICCRNVLIYFSREAQERVQRLLVSCLVSGGYLCLGEAEALSPRLLHCFEVVDARSRLFRLRDAVAPPGSEGGQRR